MKRIAGTKLLITAILASATSLFGNGCASTPTIPTIQHSENEANTRQIVANSALSSNIINGLPIDEQEASRGYAIFGGTTGANSYGAGATIKIKASQDKNSGMTAYATNGTTTYTDGPKNLVTHWKSGELGYTQTFLANNPTHITLEGIAGSEQADYGSRFSMTRENGLYGVKIGFGNTINDWKVLVQGFYGEGKWKREDIIVPSNVPRKGVAATQGNFERIIANLSARLGIGNGNSILVSGTMETQDFKNAVSGNVWNTAIGFQRYGVILGHQTALTLTGGYGEHTNNLTVNPAIPSTSRIRTQTTNYFGSLGFETQTKGNDSVYFGITGNTETKGGVSAGYIVRF